MRRKPARLADEHYGLLDARCFEVVRVVVRALEEREADYVLVGGWAVYAYGSRVPSVDTDVFLRANDLPPVAAAVESLGVTVGHGRQFEPLSMESSNVLLGIDVDMQEPERGFVPEALLRHRRARRALDLGEAGRVEATVPSPEALLFMKLKAYHDRSLAWMAVRDDVVMARRIPPAERPHVREMTVGYYYRKAGKDLYDAGFLAAHADAMEGALAIARETGLEEDLSPLLRDAPAPLRAFALAMARQERDEATAAWIAALP